MSSRLIAAVLVTATLAVGWYAIWAYPALRHPALGGLWLCLIGATLLYPLTIGAVAEILDCLARWIANRRG